MAKEQKPPEPVVVEETLSPKPKSYRMHILLGLVGVVLAETLILFFLLPSPEKLKREITDIKGTVIDKESYVVSTEIAPDPDLRRIPLVEKPLGDKFKVQSVRPGPEQIVDVFTVTIRVQVAKKEETAFDRIYAEREFAIRDAVIVVLRSSTLDDRNQMSSTNIRRSVQKAVNEVLGIAYIKGVLCIDPIVEMN
jgi:hypothetical protein